MQSKANLQLLHLGASPAPLEGLLPQRVTIIGLTSSIL